jgi:hypothetical protein
MPSKTKKRNKKIRTFKKRRHFGGHPGDGFVKNLRSKTRRNPSPQRERRQIINPNGRSTFNRFGRSYVVSTQPPEIKNEWKEHKYAVSNKYGPNESSFYAGPALENSYLYETQGTQPIPHGKDGTVVYSTGHVYKGDFNQGKREGYGTLQVKEGKINGPTYEGEWKDDKFVPFLDYKKNKIIINNS